MARILVVDDASFMRMVIQQILTKAGHTVIAEASNGLEAVKKYIDHQPDLVTMDITMPEMDGISAIRVIRAKDQKANIVVCSAMGQQSMVIEAIQAGAKDFIVKPFNPERVIEAVTKVLESSKGVL